MPVASPASRWLRRQRSALASFTGERSGVAAIEFALFMPVLLCLLFAGVELVNAIDNQRKVNQLARTLADLTSQGDAQSSTSTSSATPIPIALATMRDVAASATPILAPYVPAATMQISAIGVYAADPTRAYVCSTWSPGTSTRSVGYAKDLTVPTNYRLPGARYVVAEVKMAYTPIFGSVAPNFVKTLTLNFNWNETVSWPVRGGKANSSTTDPEVILPSGKVCP